MRFVYQWAVLALASCVPAVWAQSTSAEWATDKSIDPALLSRANAGDAAAQYQLGNVYYLGQRVRRNYAQAAFWFRKAAEQGDPDSEFQLGGLYHFGQGVPQDNAQAFAWVMKAAKQGDADAEFYISTCYTEGWGVAKDEAQGMDWLRKAAEQGHFSAQYQLGWAYEAGDVGVPQDFARAYFWLDLASQGSEPRKDRKEAVKRRDEAASHLTPEKLSSEHERVQKWLQDHPANSQ